MGRLLTDEGKLQQARPLLESSLATRKQFFHAGHPTIAKTLCSLGQLEIKEGRRDEAIDYLTEALHKQSKILGKQHPDTLETANSLKQAQAMQASKISKTFRAKTEK